VRFERAGRYYEFGRSQWELWVSVASGQWGMLLLQTQCERRRNVDLSLFKRACSGF
jgi:hypothetical protein